ncbi:MAG: ribulose-phosphate 3-epimerase [Calditrichia bacterium]
MIPQQTDYKILPSILSADFGKFAEEAKTVDIQEIDHLHIDVMDGHFVPNLTIGPQVVESLKKHTRFKFDVHLMIENAPEFIPRFAEAGADFITIHQEAVIHLHRNIYLIKEHGVKAGVTINPATSLESIRWVLNDVDLVLIMSVNPGFGGQEFIPASVEKIRQLAKWREEMGANFIIEVDGGIEPETIGQAYAAGARYFVSGSFIFSKADRPGAIRSMIRSIEDTRRKMSSKLV